MTRVSFGCGGGGDVVFVMIYCVAVLQGQAASGSWWCGCDGCGVVVTIVVWW
jgi:hypothetical protein